MTGAAWPAARRDDKSAPFFDAAANGRLEIKRCPADGQLLAPEASSCDRCGGAELEWAPAVGSGQLVSWTVVHRAPTGAHAELVPYTVGIVELLEGPWLYARIVDTPRPAVGLRLQARFVHPDDGDGYPVFGP